MSASWPSRHLVVALLASAVALFPLAAAHAVTETEEPSTPGVAAVAITVAPVMADGADTGDLRSDPGTGLATLTFRPDGPQTQRAVLTYEVTNTGEVDLQDLVVEASRIGTLRADVATLAPGASATVRGVLEITGEQARTGLAGLVPVDATVTASTADGATVTDAVTQQLQVVAVLAAPTGTVVLEVVTDAGDVGIGSGDVPALRWSNEEAVGAVAKQVVHRVTVTNTGTVALADVVAVVELLGEAVEVQVAEAIAAGGSAEAEVTHAVLPDAVASEDATGSAEAELTATVVVTATDDSGTQSLSLTGGATVLGVVMLPAAGPPTRPELALVAVLSIGFGFALLAAAPRPRRA